MQIEHSRFRHALVLILLGSAGCSSTGFSTQTDLVVPSTIRSPKNVPAEVVQYVPRFVGLLQDKGFAVGETDDPQALDLVFEFNGNPFNLRVSASLWRDGVPVLTASATNSGWGTAIARGSAVNSLADSAATTFQSELAALMVHTRIVSDSADSPARASATGEPSKYDELERLKELLDDGALTQQEFEQEKAKVLARD